MNRLSCPIVRVESIEPHPTTSKLNLITLEGQKNMCVSANHYNPGDWVVYVPSQSILPKWLLKHMGFWNEEKDRGTLAGNKGDRVKPIKLQGIVSEGLIHPVDIKTDITHINEEFNKQTTSLVVCDYGIVILNITRKNQIYDISGYNVSEFLGVSNRDSMINPLKETSIYN